MRQQWIARWEEDGEKRSSIFFSMEWESIARVAFQLKRMTDNMSVPENFMLEKMGDPFMIGEPNGL